VSRHNPLHIVLVRHGQTDANVQHIVQGHTPTSLNALGHQQASLVARRLASFEPRIELIVSSDLPRTRETAAPLAAALGLGVHYDAAWRERCYGTFEGLTREARLALRDKLGMGPHDLPPGAQTEADYQNGIREALLRLPSQYPHARCIAVVTHGGACRAVTMMLADGRLPGAPGNLTPADFACPNGAVTHLVLETTPDGPRYRYGCVYDVTHLNEPETVTVTDAG
jgi:probable phosphoglycerate mutase